ncbi:uncharacterized protein LOC124173206 isoform X3 [Ischnura elegans]|uniref:uncharacterized protein LOC124173206 isoform X3 n=1 Tax=Ischnura elegans TaxID=197161 RepID=UPI001ED88E8B|nr:uncharacterized protein LOC124173206 isoform X3 [Ischnura elegans]
MSVLSLLLCLQSFEREGAVDDNFVPSVETKDCIQDAIENNSQPTCSAQTTEINIPVPDCLLPRDDKLFHVKEENQDPLSEGNNPQLYTSDPAAITNDASDPLATDLLQPNTLTASQGEKVEALGTGANFADMDWTLVGAKEEPSPEDNAQGDPVTYKCSSVK